MALDKTKDPNHLFKMRLGQGEKPLRILLSKRSSASVSVSGNRRGPSPTKQGLMPSSRPAPDELIVKKGAFINFYDMGQVKDEFDAWVDLDFKVLDVDFLAGSNVDDPQAHAISNYSTAETGDLRDLLLSVPIDQFEDKYRKLEYEEAEKYGIDVFVNNETVYPVARNDSRNTLDGLPITESKWTPKGLKLPAIPTQLEFVTGVAFEPFSTNLDAYKITEDPDYEADPVENFKLAKRANVFMVPMVTNVFSKALTFDGSTVEPRQTLFGAYSPVSRSTWLDVTDPSIDNPVFAKVTLGADLDVIDPGMKSLLLGYVLGLIPIKSYLTEWDSSTPTVIDWLISELGSGSFPMFDWIQTLFNQSGDDGLPMAQNNIPSGPAFGSGDRIEGQLVGIIKQSNKVFYFWFDSNDGPAGTRASWTFTAS